MVLSAHLSPENRAVYEALSVDAMVSKPFDVHQLRATVTRLANGMKAASGENATQLSPVALHKVLKTALLEHEPKNLIRKRVREGHEKDSLRFNAF